jgi:hypothetical protein
MIIEVKVKPNSPKFSINIKDKIIIHCKSPPEKNKANLEIIKELRKLFKKDIEIISGLKSKNKKILIHNISENQMNEILKQKYNI